MSIRIITKEDYVKFFNTRYNEPMNFASKVCRSREFLFNKLDPNPTRDNRSPRAADGVSLAIRRTRSGGLDIRTSQYFIGQNVVSSFVILREVLTTQLLTGFSKSLNIRIYQEPEAYLVICGSSDACNEDERMVDEGEGVKVKIPKPAGL